MVSAPRKGIPLKPPENYWSFVPISPEAHEAAFQAAADAGMPLNAWLSQLIKYVGETGQLETDPPVDVTPGTEPDAIPSKADTNGAGGDDGDAENGAEPDLDDSLHADDGNGAEYREVEIAPRERNRAPRAASGTAGVERYTRTAASEDRQDADEPLEAGEAEDGLAAMAESERALPPAATDFSGGSAARGAETPEFVEGDTGGRAGPSPDFDDGEDDAAPAGRERPKEAAGGVDDFGVQGGDEEPLELTADQIAEPGPGADSETAVTEPASEPEPEVAPEPEEEPEPEIEAAEETGSGSEDGEKQAGDPDMVRVQPRREFSAHVTARPGAQYAGSADRFEAGEITDDEPPAPPPSPESEQKRREAVGDTDEASSGPILVPASQLRPSSLKLEAKPDEREIQAALNILSETGSLQAIIVRPAEGGTGDGDGTWEIVYGETRWRAALRSRMDEVPVLVRLFSDQEALIYSVRESLAHRTLSPLAEAACYQRLKDEFGLSDEDLGPAVGKSPEHVADILRFLDLPSAVRKMMEDGSLSAIHARALLAANDPEAAASEVVRRGLDIFQTEQLVRNANNGVRLGTAETD